MENVPTTIDGPAGDLEIRYDRPAAPDGIQSVLCHPHPQYGGSMNDAVLDCLANVLLTAGVGVLRFNFRGVGSSGGRYDSGPGEVEDLLTAARWLRDHHPGDELWAGGYSFGAWVIWQALGEGLEVDRALLVAPPIGMMPFPAREQTPPVEVVIGDADDFADPRALDAWSVVTVHPIAGADHFFTGRLDALADRLRDLVEAR